MADYIFPTSVLLREVEANLMPNLLANREGFKIFPIMNEDSHILEWDQDDNFVGLQNVRGMGGDPSRIARTGSKRYLMTPGVYGEYLTIDENDITARAMPGFFDRPIDITSLVRKAQDQLLGRRIDRIEQIIWTLLVTGTFSIANGNTVMATDSYTTQSFAAGTAWSTAATSTPLADLRAVKLKHRGYSVRFDQSATAYMNLVTANRMLSNTNAADLGGRRSTGLSTVNNIDDMNKLLIGDGLPMVSVYDEGYVNDAGTFVPFIADGKVVVVGKRSNGAAIGNYRITRNASNLNAAPGPYTKVVDDPNRVPRLVEVHDGHNGGPVIYFPSAIVVMTV